MNPTRSRRLKPATVPLPTLSDAAAFELYLFVEDLLIRIESHYAAQIRRHFQDRNRGPAIEPEASPCNEELPF
jgi:hypothetical protein